MKSLLLRPFCYETDIRDLYAYMTEPCSQALFSHKFQINTIHGFEKWLTEMLRTQYHDFFMIADTAGNTLGFTFSYDFFPNDGHCKFTLCLYTKYTKQGFGVIAAVKMLDYLFSSYSLLQVFTTVFSYNHESLAIHKHGGFRKVGELPNYRYFRGSLHSLHCYVIEREVFYDVANRFLSR